MKSAVISDSYAKRNLNKKNNIQDERNRAIILDGGLIFKESVPKTENSAIHKGSLYDQDNCVFKSIDVKAIQNGAFIRKCSENI